MDIARTPAYALLNTHRNEMAATIAIHRDAVEALSVIIRAGFGYISLSYDSNQREHAVEMVAITTAPRRKREPKDKTSEFDSAVAVQPEKPEELPDRLPATNAGNRANCPDFELLSGNIPSYLRRSAIRDALGLVTSHSSRFNQWNDKKSGIITSKKTDRQKMTAFSKLGKPPTLQPKTVKTAAENSCQVWRQQR